MIVRFLDAQVRGTRVCHPLRRAATWIFVEGNRGYYATSQRRRESKSRAKEAILEIQCRVCVGRSTASWDKIARLLAVVALLMVNPLTCFCLYRRWQRNIALRFGCQIVDGKMEKRSSEPRMQFLDAESEQKACTTLLLDFKHLRN